MSDVRLQRDPGLEGPVNIAELLEMRAAERPFQRAVVFPHGRDGNGRTAWTHLTFQALNTLTDEIAHGLVARGVARGDRVSLLAKPCLEFIPLVFACFKVGAIPVLIDPGMGRKQFLSCIERMRPRVLVAEPLVHLLRPFVGSALRSVEVAVSMGTGVFGAVALQDLRVQGADPFPARAVEASDEAAILFTSGSTGPAKGVTYTHGIFATQTRLIGRMYGIEPGEIELACFPLFGLFSMALGMTVVIPEMDPTKPSQVDPRKIVEAITSQGCTSAAGSPAIWKRVAPYCLAEGVRLPSLRRILMFGAPIPVPLHQAFRKILAPGADVHTPYGATECLPVATIGTTEILDDTAKATREGAGTCVGRPVREAEVAIIRVSDEPFATFDRGLEVESGTIGEITVAGPMVTPEYKDEPEHTRAAKMDDGGRVRHRMGDVGYLDAEGRLWFCGRKSHRVVLGDGRTLFTVQGEGVLDEVAGVFRTAIVGVKGRAVACVELERDADWAATERALVERAKAHDATRDVGSFLAHPGFPVDVRHNAKIDRTALAVWAATRV